MDYFEADRLVNCIADTRDFVLGKIIDDCLFLGNSVIIESYPLDAGEVLVKYYIV